MAAVCTLLLLLDLALIVVALFDCWSADEARIRLAPRAAWVFGILLISPIGGIAWFVKGRPVREVRLRPRPVAPDDDPEFLRRLAAGIRQANEEPG